MSRRAASFTQADLARALKAADQVAPGKWRVRVTSEGEICMEPIEGPARLAPMPDLIPSPAEIVKTKWAL